MASRGALGHLLDPHREGVHQALAGGHPGISRGALGAPLEHPGIRRQAVAGPQVSLWGGLDRLVQDGVADYCM